jgi:hypothetical protein
MQKKFGGESVSYPRGGDSERPVDEALLNREQNTEWESREKVVPLPVAECPMCVL